MAALKRSRRKDGMKTHSINEHNPPAFTLIEILVVIAIIAVLAALLFPGLTAARKQVNDSKCISNLRQLGVAINEYAADHSGILPGPSTGGVGRALASNQQTQLIYFLQPYLGLPTPTTTAIYPAILHCPAVDDAAAKQGTAWYNLTQCDAYSNNDLPTNMQYVTTVFGGISSGGNTQPLRLANIESSINRNLKNGNPNSGSASTIAVIREIDSTLKSWPWAVAATPLHGDHGNALFLDWHVGRVYPADYKVP